MDLIWQEPRRPPLVRPSMTLDRTGYRKSMDIMKLLGLCISPPPHADAMLCYVMHAMLVVMLCYPLFVCVYVFECALRYANALLFVPH